MEVKIEAPIQRNDFLHQCLVRQLIAWSIERGADWMRNWLTEAERRMPAEYVQRLRDDARAQMERGNRGEYGVWL